MIIIRRAVLNDDKDFSELLLMTAHFLPLLFGDKINSVLQNLFNYHSNLFSHDHVWFAEVDGEKVGMILGYDWKTKRRDNLKTGFLLFIKIGFSFIGKIIPLLKFDRTVGNISDGEYYISNIATHEKFRGQGVGRELIRMAEKEAEMTGCKTIMLDVEKENTGAISFYERQGFKPTKEFSISLQKDRVLNFARMSKEVGP
jgi:ribosomal protein S18 acetylase RimI-like enzyme